MLFISAFVLQGQDPPLIPKLVALQKELEAGNRAALENFWQEVTKQGAPLVEPIKGENRFVWLTFLWRAKEETKNVVRDVLQAKGYPVQLQEINGGHDFFNWQAGLADGLTSLLNTKAGEMKR